MGQVTSARSHPAPESSLGRLELDEVAAWLDAGAFADAAQTAWPDLEQHLVFEPAEAADVERFLGDLEVGLRSGHYDRSGAHRQAVWERGWAEVLERVEREGVSFHSLRPQYFKHPLVRLSGRYVAVTPGLFEHALCHAIRYLAYRRWGLAEPRRVLDLGAGTGANVHLLASLYPDSEIVGADWAEPSVRLMGAIGAASEKTIRGVRVDLLSLEGWEGVGDLEGALVTSVHAFEQLGDRCGPVLDRLIEARPARVVQLEPVLEHYTDAPFDACPSEYHRTRGYLTGYLPALEREAERGRIELLEVRKLPVGTSTHDPYSLLVWRPR